MVPRTSASKSPGDTRPERISESSPSRTPCTRAKTRTRTREESFLLRWTTTRAPATAPEPRTITHDAAAPIRPGDSVVHDSTAVRNVRPSAAAARWTTPSIVMRSPTASGGGDSGEGGGTVEPPPWSLVMRPPTELRSRAGAFPARRSWTAVFSPPCRRSCGWDSIGLLLVSARCSGNVTSGPLLRVRPAPPCPRTRVRRIGHMTVLAGVSRHMCRCGPFEPSERRRIDGKRVRVTPGWERKPVEDGRHLDCGERMHRPGHVQARPCRRAAPGLRHSAAGGAR